MNIQWNIDGTRRFLRRSHLGASSLIASRSEIDFFLKHGAKSSSSKSPWQPVSAATFFFTDNGSRWMAHGDRAEPLIRIARWIRSGKGSRNKLNRWIWLKSWPGGRGGEQRLGDRESNENSSAEAATMLTSSVTSGMFTCQHAKLSTEFAFNEFVFRSARCWGPACSRCHNIFREA